MKGVTGKFFNLLKEAKVVEEELKNTKKKSEKSQKNALQIICTARRNPVRKWWKEKAHLSLNGRGGC